MITILLCDHLTWPVWTKLILNFTVKHWSSLQSCQNDRLSHNVSSIQHFIIFNSIVTCFLCDGSTAHFKKKHVLPDSVYLKQCNEVAYANNVSIKSHNGIMDRSVWLNMVEKGGSILCWDGLYS